MRKIFAVALVLGAAMVATPALADPVADDPFAGPHVSVEAGIIGDDFANSDKTTYGAQVGYDIRVAPRVTVGPVVGYTGLFDDDDTGVRELSAGARLGYDVARRTQVYATAAYSNVDADGVDSVSGYKVGVGVEHVLPVGVSLRLEQRYANYDTWFMGDNLWQS